jgi:hypothetical protein
MYRSEKIFLTPKIFWRRGEVAEIKLFRKNFFRKWSGTIRKVGQIYFCPPNFFLPVRPWVMAYKGTETDVLYGVAIRPRGDGV